MYDCNINPRDKMIISRYLACPITCEYKYLQLHGLYLHGPPDVIYLSICNRPDNLLICGTGSISQTKVVTGYDYMQAMAWASCREEQVGATYLYFHLLFSVQAFTPLGHLLALLLFILHLVIIIALLKIQLCHLIFSFSISDRPMIRKIKSKHGC